MVKENSLYGFWQDLKERKIIVSEANLKNFFQLEEEEKKIYYGIDCTSDKLHIGHLFFLIQVIRFSKENFKIFLILGGATSKIGDPSDKKEERPSLNAEKIVNFELKIEKRINEILNRVFEKKPSFLPLDFFFSDNPELIKKIYEILGIKKEDKREIKWEKYWKYIFPINKIEYEILNNNVWLDKKSFIDFVNSVRRKITIKYLLAKKTIKERLEKGGLSFSAFSYSLLQAYDFYYLNKNFNCQGQIGGEDQWGNMTTGLKLINVYSKKNKSFAFSFNLLLNNRGIKYSKSNEKENFLEHSEKKNFFEFFRNMSDKQALIFIKQFTFFSKKQIEKLLELNNPPSLRIIQRILYELIFFLNYGYYEK